MLKPILFEKVWGGRRLEQWGKSIPRGARVGESWEVAAIPEDLLAGSHGGALNSEIINGSEAGLTLHDMMAVWSRSAFLGDSIRTSAPGFPLLVKLLDATENLSIQVHPSPAYAA
ncbi:MAG: type I phosphomannose isomerase catalytic subunit, partial [Planctomycetota bacterium]